MDLLYVAETTRPPVPTAPVVVNNRFTVTNIIIPSNQFFRLRKPFP